MNNISYLDQFCVLVKQLVEHGVELDGKVCTIDQFTKLNELTKRKALVNIQLRGFDELEIGVVGEVKKLALDVNGIDEFSEGQKVLNAEMSREFLEI